MSGEQRDWDKCGVHRNTGEVVYCKSWLIWQCGVCEQYWHVNSRRLRVAMPDVMNLKCYRAACDVDGNFTPIEVVDIRADPPDPGRGFAEYGPRRRWRRKP